MRLPKVTKYDDSVDTEVVHLEPIQFEPKFYDLGRDKDKFKYITTIEKMCRASMEYRDLIEFLRVNMGMNFCSFFHNVSRDKASGSHNRIRIEIHHEPFTLYDITAIILNNRIDSGEPTDMLSICDEVMQCHYEGIVGLLPLSQTVHELVHSGKLFVPLQFIDEGFNEFYNRYNITIKNMDGLSDMLAAKVRLSKQFAENREEFISILRKKYIYVINHGYESTPETLPLVEKK